MPEEMYKYTIDTSAPVTGKSDKDSHFTTAIAQYATEEENLTGLQSNKIRIRSLAMLAEDLLKFRLLFFKTDGFANADLDLDTFIAAVDFDLPNHALQIASAGKYYLSIEGLDILYEDDDDTYELHVALQNIDVSGTAKGLAGVGELVIKYVYQDAQFE